MRSDTVTKGKQQAPHRSLFNALGLTEEEMNRPLVGIVCSYNEIVPGHMNLDKIANAVKQGVAMAGGTPIMFPAIAVCDGIAMGHIGMKYSLVTRDLIADSTEAMAMAHQFDALVMIPNCDKNVPGLLMAAARFNVPTFQHVRGSRSKRCRNDVRCRSVRIREQSMSDMRIMFRNVHSEQYELSDRSTWYGTSWKWNNSGSLFRKNPSKRYHDKRSNPECTYG